jgi:phosphotransferase system HPr (HPr) family protein
MAMASVDVVFRDRYGLHPRSAMRIQQTAAGFKSKTTIESIESSGRPADASSMIALVSMGVRNGDKIRVTTTGPDEEAALEALKLLIENGVCHK